ncbi:MAG: hypothetical protein ACK40Y_01350 [Cloacibacterium caeni]
MKQKDKSSLERYLQKLEFARSAGSEFAFETKEQRAAAIEACKNDPRKMVERYFPHYADAPCADFQIEWAWMVAKNKRFRGFAQWGRALAKSVWNNIFIPFWIWLREGHCYFVLIGNSNDKANQLLEDIRAEFEANPRILADFGEQKVLGSWEDGFFQTKGNFIAQALGMGQSVRGLRVKNKRPSLINCDDLETKDINANPKRQIKMVNWIVRDLIPTMDGEVKRFTYSNNRFAPIMIQTRLQELYPKWKVHQVNAYDPVTYVPTWTGKYDNMYFRYVEEDIGRLAAMAEYNNTPHVEGTVFKDEMINWVDLPRIDHFECIIGHWDIAYAGNATSDYNSVIVEGLKQNNFYVIDLFCKQTKMKAPLRWMSNFQSKLPASVKIRWQYESQFWNDEVQRTIDEVQKETGVRLNLVKVSIKGKKIDRIMSMVPYYQNNRVHYNKKIKSNNDTQIALAQLKGIEPGYNCHDDYPDAHEACTKELEKYTPVRKGKNLMGKMKPKYSW